MYRTCSKAECLKLADHGDPDIGDANTANGTLDLVY